MADSLPTDEELDALIEAALRDEPLLPAPRGLQRRIQEQVLFASLKEQERARFRRTLLGAVGAVMVILLGTVAVVSLTHFSILYRHGVSGGRGFVDYYLTLLDVSWSGQIGVFALVGTLGLSAIALWAGLVLFRYERQLVPRHSMRTGQTETALREAH